MRVLLLGPYRQSFVEFFEKQGDSVHCFDEQITFDMSIVKETDWLVSYGYRYLIRQEVLNKFGVQAINLHISLLPWNRGADPNLWSFLEDTPKGVTIHRIDPAIDTGDIIAQKEVVFSEKNDTLQSTYVKLSNEIEKLFFSIWSPLKSGLIVSSPQKMGGSYHRSKDKEKYKNLLVAGWDTPIHYLIGRAL